MTHQFDLSFPYFLFLFVYIFASCLLFEACSLHKWSIRQETRIECLNSTMLQSHIWCALMCQNKLSWRVFTLHTGCRSLLPPVGAVRRWILRWLSTKCKVVDFQNAKRWFITFHDDIVRHPSQESQFLKPWMSTHKVSDAHKNLMLDLHEPCSKPSVIPLNWLLNGVEWRFQCSMMTLTLCI